MTSKKHQNERFRGFKRVYFQEFFVYPNMLEEYWHQMSGSEQKCLDFILRQTIGFRKQVDRISYSQFVSGIGARNKGTGLSLSQVRRATKSLEIKGFIKVYRYQNRPSAFALVFEGDEDLEKIAFNDFIQTLRIGK